MSGFNPLTGRFEGYKLEAPMQEAPPPMMAPVTPQEPVAQVEPLPEPAVIEPPVPPPVQYSDDFGGRGQEQLGLPAIKMIEDMLSGSRGFPNKPNIPDLINGIEPATPVDPIVGGPIQGTPFGGMGGIFGGGRPFGGGSPVGGLNSGIGSFLRPIINEVTRNKDQKLQEKISPYIDEVTQLTQNTFPEVNFSGQGQNVFTDYPAFFNQKDFGNFFK